MRRLRTLESRVQRTRRQAEDDTEKIRHIKEAALRTVESQKELISRLGAKNVKYAALLKRARDRLKAKSSDESLIAEIDDVLTAKMKTGRLTMGSCEETNAIWEGRP